jgi:hypothetical protein
LEPVFFDEEDGDFNALVKLTLSWLTMSPPQEEVGELHSYGGPDKRT